MHEVEYFCEACDIVIDGISGDPQEAPRLYCPICGDKMMFDIDW